MSNQQITVPFDEMFLLQDLQRAQHLKERVRLFIGELTHAFHKCDFATVGHYTDLIQLGIQDLTEMSNARANYERGFKEGVLKSEGINQLVEALRQEGVVMIATLGGGLNLENDHRS